MNKLAALAILVALVFPASAFATSLDVTKRKFPGYLRVVSSYEIAAPQCVQDEFGSYPNACYEGDIVYRVARKTSSGGWRGVLREAWPVLPDFDTLRGRETERIYWWEFRDYSYIGRAKCRRHRLVVRLVDEFSGTPDPARTRYFRACYRFG